MDRVLAKIQLGGEVERVNEERSRTVARLRRLGEVYLDGLKTREDYLRDKKGLADTLASLIVPGVDAAQEAGKLLENLPSLWEEANLTERRKLLLAMLEAVYVDTVEEKAIVAILPKPALRPLFEIATTREGSDVILINEPPLAIEPEAADLCFWWRRGRVELPVQKALWPDIYRLIRSFVSRVSELPPTESPLRQPMFLWLPRIGIGVSASRTFGARIPVSGPNGEKA